MAPLESARAAPELKAVESASACARQEPTAAEDEEGAAVLDETLGADQEKWSTCALWVLLGPQQANIKHNGRVSIGSEQREARACADESKNH
jgi:hypothetical protein